MQIPRMQKAFAGMKADASYDYVKSYCSAGDTEFGLVVGVNADGNVVPGGGTRLAGISLHDHTKLGGYKQYDMVSTETKGPAWCQVADGADVTPGGPVQFDANGRVGDAAGTALPNASFGREYQVETLPDGSVIAVVELAAPFATAPAA